MAKITITVDIDELADALAARLSGEKPALVVSKTEPGSEYTRDELESLDRSEVVEIAASLELSHGARAHTSKIIDLILEAQGDEDEDFDEEDLEDEDLEGEEDDDEADEDLEDDDSDEDEDDDDSDDEDDSDDDEEDEDLDDDEDDEEDEDDDESDDEEDDEFWTEDELKAKAIGELKAIAREYDIETTGLKKDALIKAIMTE